MDATRVPLPWPSSGPRRTPDGLRPLSELPLNELVLLHFPPPYGHPCHEWQLARLTNVKVPDHGPPYTWMWEGRSSPVKKQRLVERSGHGPCRVEDLDADGWHPLPKIASRK